MTRSFIAAALLAVIAAPGNAQLPSPVTVQLLAPGVISRGFSEFGGAITADGNELYYTATDVMFSRMTILRAQRAGGEWRAAGVASFSGTWNDGDVTMSPDGRRILYISNRPASGNTPNANLDIWMVERAAGGEWSAPVRLPDVINTSENETYPSMTAAGVLYFGRGPALYRAQQSNGTWTVAPVTFAGTQLARVGAPAIAPDESFMILNGPGATDRDADLYVSFSRAGTWTEPTKLPEPINSASVETAASISPDGRTLYFASQRVVRPTPTWPRAQRVRSIADVESEFGALAANSLRDIYVVDISELRAP